MQSNKMHLQRLVKGIDTLLRNQEYDRLEALVVEQLAHGLLDDDVLLAARMLDLRPAVIYLATLGVENLPDPGRRALWVGAYRSLGRQSEVPEFAELPDHLPIKWVVRNAMANATTGAAGLHGCHGKQQDWLDAVDFSVDIRRFDLTLALVRRLASARISQDVWLQLSSHFMQRHAYVKDLAGLEPLGQAVLQVARHVPGTLRFRNVRSVLAHHAGECFQRAGAYKRVLEAMRLSTDPTLERARLAATAQAWCWMGDLPRSIQAMDRMLEQVGTPLHLEILERERHDRGYDRPEAGQFDSAVAGQAIVDLQAVLAQTGLKVFLVSGTLLGYARCGGLLPHDKDIDVGVLGWECQYDMIPALLGSGLFQIDNGLRTLQGQDTYILPVRHLPTGIPVDVFIYHQIDGRYVTGVQGAFGYVQRFAFTPFGLREVDFLGIRIHVPDDVDRNLTENFGDWRVPDPGYISHLESPSTMDVGGLTYQLVGRLRCLDAILLNKRSMLLRALDCLAKVRERPGGMSQSLIESLRTLEAPFLGKPVQGGQGSSGEILHAP